MSCDGAALPFHADANYGTWSINFEVYEKITISKKYISALKMCNKFCIPESFNVNISHKLFDYIITFVILQH